MSHKFDISNTENNALFNSLMKAAQPTLREYFSDVCHDVAYIMSVIEQEDPGKTVSFNWAVRKSGTHIRLNESDVNLREWVEMIKRSCDKARFFRVEIKVSNYGLTRINIEQIMHA